MVILLSILLVAMTAAVILYPFVRRSRHDDLVDDEGAPEAELGRRWDAALDGLRSAELERTIGNLSEEDYQWLREQYMSEAALTLKAMEIEERQRQELLDTIEYEVQRVREMTESQNGLGPLARCQGCGAESPEDAEHCPACGHVLEPPPGPLSSTDPGTGSGPST